MSHSFIQQRSTAHVLCMRKDNTIHVFFEGPLVNIPLFHFIYALTFVLIYLLLLSKLFSSLKNRCIRMCNGLPSVTPTPIC